MFVSLLSFCVGLLHVWMLQFTKSSCNWLHRALGSVSSTMSNKLLSLYDYQILVPTLPAAWYNHVTQTFDVMASQKYVAFTKCSSCYSRLVPLWTRQLNCMFTLQSNSASALVKNFDVPYMFISLLL